MSGIRIDAMKCKECAEGKKYAEGSVMCIQYGIIIRADHDCIREGGRIREREPDADHSGDISQQTGIPENEWDAINRIEGIL